MHRTQKILIGLTLFLAPLAGAAQPVVIDTGVHTTIPQLISGIINVLLQWSGLVATGLFLLGATLMVASGGEDSRLTAGKKIMKASIIGLAFILASWLILSTVVSFVAS
jgi:hypothetical protein